MGHGDADDVAALAADHLAVRDVFLEILANLSADDLPKSPLIALDFHGHGRMLRGRKSLLTR